MAHCWLRTHLQHEYCDTHAKNFVLYVKPSAYRGNGGPPALSEPSPAPPMLRIGPAVDRINAQFRSGGPSDDMSAIGVILHQLDNFEDDPLHPWRFCEQSSCSTWHVPGRVSAFTIYKSLHDRRDRIAISLPLASRGGFVLRNSAVEFECVYGMDARSVEYATGCSPQVCDPERLRDGRGRVVCGVTGQPTVAFAPSQMKLGLEMHRLYGEVYQQPGCKLPPCCPPLALALLALLVLPPPPRPRTPPKGHLPLKSRYRSLSPALAFCRRLQITRATMK